MPQMSERFLAREYGTAKLPPCFPGKYQPEENATSCHDCPVGYFGNGTISCARCPLGSRTLQSGSARCQICPGGHYGESCKACSPGMYRDGNDGDAFSCKPCEPGFFQYLRGELSCTKCYPGFFKQSFRKHPAYLVQQVDIEQRGRVNNLSSMSKRLLSKT